MLNTVQLHKFRRTSFRNTAVFHRRSYRRNSSRSPSLIRHPWYRCRENMNLEMDLGTSGFGDTGNHVYMVLLPRRLCWLCRCFLLDLQTNSMATCILYRPLSIFHLRPTCCTVDRMDCHRKLFLLLKKAAYRHRRESFLLLHHRSIESIHHQHIFEYQRSS
jgi:hypothetical protein